MKRLLIRLLKRPIKNILIRELTKNKDEWLRIANSRFDIPKLTEDEEAKLMNGIYVTILEALTKALDKI